MFASKEIAIGFFLCLAMAVVAEPRYALRERTMTEVSHATAPNMHKWSAAKHGLRVRRELGYLVSFLIPLAWYCTTKHSLVRFPTDRRRLRQSLARRA